MSAASSNPQPARTADAENIRRYPRLDINVPVELRSGSTLVVGRSRNVSLGGLSLMSPIQGIVGDVILRFTLPGGGHTVNVVGRIVHVQPQGELGIRFGDMSPEQFTLLATGVQGLLGYTRGGTRIATRLVLTLRPRHADSGSDELVETQYVSRRGALVLCRASFRVNERLYLWWPERTRGIDVHVIYRRQVGDFFEMGLSFDDDHDFWGLTFPD